MSPFLPMFTIGQLIYHKRLKYRGVIVGVHAEFQGTDNWYETVAQSRPPKDRPWYVVLVHGQSHSTYVAERHLQPDTSTAPIEHPELKKFFDRFSGGVYSNTDQLH